MKALNYVVQARGRLTEVEAQLNELLAEAPPSPELAATLRSLRANLESAVAECQRLAAEGA